MKKWIVILLFLCCYSMCNGQTQGGDTVIKPNIDTPVKPIKLKPIKRKIITPSFSKHIDSVFKKDEVGMKHDSIPALIVVSNKNDSIIFLKNQLLQITARPVFMINSQRLFLSKEIVFYIICFFLLLFGLFKAFHYRYFNNVFKVFFNTSLRQNQLTDILLQARLASLMFNVLFVISAGLYMWQLFIYKGYFDPQKLIMLPICIGLVILIYVVKFLMIKFIGWITTFKVASNQYVFVIFLINKIIAVFLIPFIILMAFGPKDWLPSIVLLTYLLIGMLFMLRYFRTYGLLQKQLSLNLLHFILYLAGIEVLPLLALYHLFRIYNGYFNTLLS